MAKRKVEPNLQSALAEAGGGYADATQLRRHQRLAARIQELFGDDDLTIAALVCGIERRRLDGLLGRGAGAWPILREWDRLRRLDADGSLEETKNAMAAVRHPGALALEVLDTLDRVDPEGSYASWGRAFRTSPRPPPSPTILELPHEIAAVFTEGTGGAAAAWAVRRERKRIRRTASLAAKRLGLWQAHGVLLDALAEGEIRAGMEALATWATSLVAVDTRERIAATITSRGGLVESAWHFRCAAQSAESLSGIPSSRWVSELGRIGFLQAKVTDRGDAFATLERLHATFSFDERGVLDLLSRSGELGYAGIHTTVRAKIDDALLAVRVHLVLSAPADEDVARGRYLRGVGAIAGATGRITTFTPAGETRELREGASALGFAAAVNPTWLGRVRGAIVNGALHVDVLAPLSDGDQVELLLSDDVQMPPEGWRNLPQANWLHACLVRSFRPQFLAYGRRHLRSLLAQRAADAVTEDALLDVLVGIAVDELPARRGPERSREAAHWIERIGRFALLSEGVPIPTRPDIDPAQIIELSRHLSRIISRLRFATGPVSRLRADGSRAELLACDRCRPTESTPLAVEDLGEGRLRMHVRGALCAENLVALDTTRRATLQQFFVVDGRARDGFLISVLSVFHAANVTVLEVVARAVTEGWALIRIEIGPASERRVVELERDLRGVPGVERVELTGAVPSDEEALLPPRRGFAEPMLSRPQPWVAGAPVPDDLRFYDREHERGLLWHALAQAGRAAAIPHHGAWVTGSYRVGKTSLVAFILRAAARDPGFGVIGALTEVSDAVDLTTAQRIERCLEDLRPQLLSAVGAWALAHPGVPLPKANSGTWEVLEAVALAPDRPAVLLGIDECMRLFNRATTVRDQRAMLDFADRLVRLPNVVPVWIGPRHGERSLPGPLVDLLGRAMRVELAPFDERTVADLIGARRLAFRYQFVVPKLVARHALEVTGGLPSWLNEISAHMWKQLGQSERARFTIHHVNAAITALQGDSTHFHHRTWECRDWLSHGQRAAARRVLVPLANLPRAGWPDDIGLSRDEVAALLDHAAGAAILQRLEDLGAVRVVPGDRFVIAAPLLAAHVRELDQRGKPRARHG